MGKRKDLSKFDKGQIVMARRLGQSISKTAALVGSSRSAVVSIYQKGGQRKEQMWTGDMVMGGQGSLLHVGSEDWPVWSDTTAHLYLIHLVCIIYTIPVLF